MRVVIGPPLRIRLQITLPSLSCEFTAVDSVDMIGDRRHDLTSSAIYKMPTGGQVVAVEHAAKTSFVAPVYGNTTDLDHYGNHRFAIEVPITARSPLIAALAPSPSERRAALTQTRSHVR